ncbi:MAG: efflux RND transporter periplasmic adaptor subunit [Elusimicrobiota bacterium]|nr:efflux RND transporter periplasmic adaptor subunit [Elusimicrobiota bacterium]
MLRKKILGFKFADRLAKFFNFKDKKVRKKLYVLGLILLLSFSGFGAFYYFKLIKKVLKDQQTQNLIQVKTIRAKRQNFTDKYPVMGTIKGTVENDLRFQTEGRIEVYNFREGNKIKKDQVIASLDKQEAITKVNYAKHKYNSEQSSYFASKEKYKVYEELFKMRNLAESKLYEAKFELESSELKVKAAYSELELAQTNLLKTTLFAPNDGILAEILVKQGEYISQQDVVCRFITDLGTNFEVDVPEKDIIKLKADQEITILSDSYGEREFTGKLSEISPIVKERTRTTKVSFSVSNEDGLLRSGMFARGDVKVKEYENIFLVPSDSIISLNDTTFLVPVVVTDMVPGEGIIQMRPSIIGDKIGEKTVVTEGLNNDELVVSETQGQLSDGVKVKFQEIDETKEEEYEEEDLPNKDYNKF